MKFSKKTKAIGVSAILALAGCTSVKAATVAPKPVITKIVYKTTPAKTVYKTSPPTVKYVTQPPVQQPSTVPVQNAPVQTPAFANSDAVVTQFYQDISDQDYSDAWNLGGDNIGGTNYNAWVAGYDTTVSISLGSFSQFSSDQVQVDLVALQSDGSVNDYQGTYTVNNGVITAADIVQTGS